MLVRRMSGPLDAIDEAPNVSVVDGEIVVVGDRICVAYTPPAARQLAKHLLRAADTAEPA